MLEWGGGRFIVNQEAGCWSFFPRRVNGSKGSLRDLTETRHIRAQTGSLNSDTKLGSKFCMMQPFLYAGSNRNFCIIIFHWNIRTLRLMVVSIEVKAWLQQNLGGFKAQPMTQQHSTPFLQWKPRKRTTEPLLHSSHCWNSSPSFVWICKQRLRVCGSQSKQWQMQTRLPVRRILMGLLVCVSCPQGLLSSPWRRYLGLRGLQLAAKYLWAVQLQRGDLLQAEYRTLDDWLIVCVHF